MSYIIRTIFPNELQLLSQLFDYNDIDHMIDENTYYIEQGILDIFVLFDEDKLLGELHVQYTGEDETMTVYGRRAYLFAFRIHKDFQGLGLGKYLLETVLSRLTKEGYSEFTIGVEDDNERAIHIYNSFGFHEFIARKYEEYQGDGYEYNLYLKRI